MKANSYYPVIMTGDVAGTAAFYQAYFLSLIHISSPRD